MPIKFSRYHVIDTNKLIPKLMWKGERPGITNLILNKMNNHCLISRLSVKLK